MNHRNSILDLVPGHARCGALTIGNFDGVHRGHASLLARTVDAAAGAPPWAMTFFPHPQVVLTGAPVPLIATIDQRLRWLHDAGVAEVLVQPFDPAFAALEPETFLDAVASRLAPRTLVLGADFRFGRHGRGTLDTACAWGAAVGCAVTTVPPVQHDGTTVSSTTIRHLLAGGDVRRAAELLGRPWQIDGEVVRGAGRGHTLGYPTVNVATANDLIVADGVYGGRITFAGGLSRVAAISVGTNPTFGDEPRHVEAFLLDYEDEPLHGPFTLMFHEYVRAQVTFHNAARLIAQIEADVQTIRAAAQRDGW